MTSDGLPKAPERWADALSALTPDLALALGPLIRGLDELVAAGDPPVAARNFADGFDGLSRRGHPHLMLASEWLLATELPLEFSRRAAHGELLHLAPAASSPQGTGRVAVLVDTGPDQAGAGRLVQLAALIVLHRRAAGRGTDLSVGILGDEPGKWLNGDLPEVLRRWLKARRAEEPAPADVESWARVVDHADEMWILTGPRLASRLPGRGRLLCSSESSWSADGADRVRVSLNGGGSDLVLPSGPVAVRALRGEALVRAVPAKAEPLPAPRLRFPGFPSSARQVLARGATSSELITLRVPYRTGQAVGRPRRHHFNGRLLAASALGRRVVALVEREGLLTAQIIGKPLGRLTDLAVPIEQLGLDPATVDEICTSNLPTLYYQSGDLLCSFDGGWWRLPPHGEPTLLPTLAMSAVPGRVFDQPHNVVPAGDGQVLVSSARSVMLPAATQIVLGAGGFAGSRDGREWHVTGPDEAPATIVLDREATVLGLVFDERGHALVTSGPGQVLVQVVRPSGRPRTLTRWSGLPAPPVVHPTLPLIVGQDADGYVVVGDVGSGTVLRHTAGELS